MADTQKVTERLARLEVAVSQGFFEAKNDRRVIAAKIDALLALLCAPQRGEDSKQAGAARDPDEAPGNHLRGVAIERAAHAEQRGVDKSAAEDPA
jgi:hypothetical protein